jgi:hypothetical protein
MREWSIAVRWSIIVVVCVMAIAIVSFLAPIPQSQTYHHFADQRSIAGIPHGMDVLSNLAFLLSGAFGLIFILRAGFVFDGGTRWAFATLFFGLILTSLGSGYYHLNPNNQSLVFDRRSNGMVSHSIDGNWSVDCASVECQRTSPAQ